MQMKKTNLILTVMFLVAATNLFFAQKKINKAHPLANSLLITVDGGGLFSVTDYQQTDLTFSYGVGMEYYFLTNTNHILGLALNLYQQDNSGYKNNLFLVDPSKYETFVRTMGLQLIYSNSFGQKNIIPYARAGVANMWLSYANDHRASEIYPNIKIDQEKSSLQFEGILGLKYLVNDFFSINVSAGYHYVANDNLDGVVFGDYDDFYLSGKIGFSINLWNKRDSDNDGITDDVDKCIYEAEDFDGFQDEDGCPDYDNDNDGISDYEDGCQNVAEDFDGFQDDDGCPELDNDGDGILDENDKCINLAEDFDGFQDEDGCPDLDNDNDGIEDDKDKCPDAAENYNGFQDDDGCPDKAPKVKRKPKRVKKVKPKTKQKERKKKDANAPRSFLIHSEATFNDKSAQIKSSSYSELNKIVEQLKKYPNTNWRIEAYIDKQNSSIEANRITQNQANAILNYFISKGLSASKFQIMGFGDGNPIASNNTVFGRMKNKRIIIRKVN